MAAGTLKQIKLGMFQEVYLTQLLCLLLNFPFQLQMNLAKFLDMSHKQCISNCILNGDGAGKVLRQSRS